MTDNNNDHKQPMELAILDGCSGCLLDSLLGCLPFSLLIAITIGTIFFYRDSLQHLLYVVFDFIF